MDLSKWSGLFEVQGGQGDGGFEVHALFVKRPQRFLLATASSSEADAIKRP